MKRIWLFLIPMLPLFSCRHDNVDELRAPFTCDSVHPSYKYCVQPILHDNCYRCHSTAAYLNNQSIFNMEDFPTLKNYLATMHYRGDSIYGSKFEALIEHRLYVIPMPPIGKMQTNDINTVERWINAGAPDN